MLDYDALRNHERKLYDAAVRQTHFRRVELQILTLNGKPRHTITNRFLGGSVQGDSSRVPAELLEATLFDDDQVLNWQNGEHRKFMARVVDARFVPELGDPGPSTVWTNLALQPSFETGVAEWSAAGGGNTPVQSTTHVYRGTYSMLVGRGAGTSTLWAQNSLATKTQINKTYTVSARLWVPAANPSNGGIRVSGAGVVALAENLTPLRDQFVRVSVTFTRNAGSGVFFYINGGNNPNREIWVDSITIAEGTDPGPEFDGSSPTIRTATETIEHAWLGGPHASASTRTATPLPPGDWVEAVAFSGPLWDFYRQGPVVDLQAQSGERRAMGSVRQVIDEPRKTRATAVINKLLRATGISDKKLRVPALKAKLPEAVTVGIRRGKKRPDSKKDKDKKKEPPSKKQIYRAESEDSYWHEAASIAQALDRELYADNHERFIVAKPQSRPVATLTERQLLSPVKVQPGTTEGPNHWIIVGAHPKGKKLVRAEVSLPPNHPLSPQSLSFNGTPYEVTEVIENKHLHRHAQAVAVGRRAREKAEGDMVSYEAEAFPVVPWFRLGSPISLPLPGGGRVSARVHQRTLPLGPDASALVLGANKRSGWR